MLASILSSGLLIRVWPTFLYTLWSFFYLLCGFLKPYSLLSSEKTSSVFKNIDYQLQNSSQRQFSVLWQTQNTFFWYLPHVLCYVWTIKGSWPSWSAFMFYNLDIPKCLHAYFPLISMYNTFYSVCSIIINNYFLLSHSQAFERKIACPPLVHLLLS